MIHRLKRAVSKLLTGNSASTPEEWRNKHWRLTSLPPELTESLDKTGISVDAKILDIGSGPGDISAWLADAGYSVLGIEKEPAALIAAKGEYPERANLQFREFDFLAEDARQLGEFDVAIDRGCMHQMTKQQRPAYVANLSACLKSGGVFCLFHRFGKKDRERGVSPEYLADQFGDSFVILTNQPHRFESRRELTKYDGRFFLMRRKPA